MTRINTGGYSTQWPEKRKHSQQKKKKKEKSKVTQFFSFLSTLVFTLQSLSRRLHRERKGGRTKRQETGVDMKWPRREIKSTEAEVTDLKSCVSSPAQNINQKSYDKAPDFFLFRQKKKKSTLRYCNNESKRLTDGRVPHSNSVSVQLIKCTWHIRAYFHKVSTTILQILYSFLTSLSWIYSFCDVYYFTFTSGLGRQRKDDVAVITHVTTIWHQWIMKQHMYLRKSTKVFIFKYFRCKKSKYFTEIFILSNQD